MHKPTLDYAHVHREPKPQLAEEPRVSRMAATGWVLGFLTMPSCFLIGTSIPAVALAPPALTFALCVIALIRVDREPARLRGRELALYGAAMSAVWIGLTGVVTVLALFLAD